MKKFSLFFLFIITLFSAQNQRFAYEYKFITDSTNRENVNKELMYLDITKEGSKFYSRQVYIADSINAALIKEANSRPINRNLFANSSGNVFLKILKRYPNDRTFLITRNGIDIYKVSDERKINWKILPEKQKIGNWETQKATTEMFGRKWIAWFSTEIPFQDGPYKFSGLPGLIVKISDISNSHVFELRSTAKFKEEIEVDSDLLQTEKGILINQNQYKKLFIEDRNDPAKSLKLLYSNGIMLEMKDSDGKDISMLEMIRSVEKTAEERKHKNNNLLELDLLK
ncbi:GLPGLI family protein [Halpernia sp. GG3]